MKAKRFLGFCGLAIVVVLSAVSCATTSSAKQPGFTPPIIDAAGNTIPGSIASLETVDLNGVEQWILLRGRNISKPVILFLHGGPGTEHMIWKELIWFEESAHFAIQIEVDMMTRELIRISREILTSKSTVPQGVVPVGLHEES
jgi:hypothetical protein